MNKSQPIKNLYQKITVALNASSNKATAQIDKTYHKKDGYQSYGIKIPILKRIIKGFKKDVLALTLEQRFNLAYLLYKSGLAEEGRVGNAVLALSIQELVPTHYDRLDNLLELSNNWDEVDDFSINVTQPLLIKYPKETLELLDRWNKSSNMWKRRASIVTFVRKIGESGKFTEAVINLCDNLIWDKEDLVQKGVGWALKDNMKGAKAVVIEYVKKLRRKGVPATITLYAVRDLKGEEKKQVINIKNIGR